VSSEGAGDGETKRLQEAAVPPANYVHPEFGYLCPTSRLRRDFRVAVVAIVLGGIIGAMVVTLRADHDRDAETERIRIDAVKTDAAEHVTDGAKSGGAKSDSAKSDSAKTGGAKADAAKPPCEDNTWADLDGNCATSKPRRVKVRAATDSPAIGAAPLGRTVSTGIATSAPAATNAPAAPQSSPPSAAPSNATASPAASQPSAAATKKPQKVARSQSRTGNDRSVRDERANGRGYAGYANAPGGYHQGANQGFFGWFW
jgi:hypothetical protein